MSSSLFKAIVATFVVIASVSTAEVAFEATLAVVAWIAVGSFVATYGIMTVPWTYVGRQQEFWMATGTGLFLAFLNILSVITYHAHTHKWPTPWECAFGPGAFVVCLLMGVGISMLWRRKDTAVPCK